MGWNEAQNVAQLKLPFALTTIDLLLITSPRLVGS